MTTSLTPEQRAACAEVERLLRELSIYRVCLSFHKQWVGLLQRDSWRIRDSSTLATAIERARAARGKP